MDHEMLPYTATYFEELIRTGKLQKSSRATSGMRNGRTGRLLQSARREPHIKRRLFAAAGKSCFSGKILGGCLEVLYDIFDNSRYADSVSMCEKYELFPPKEDWAGKIFASGNLRRAASAAAVPKNGSDVEKRPDFRGDFGIICGKPMDELYFEEYKKYS